MGVPVFAVADVSRTPVVALPENSPSLAVHATAAFAAMVGEASLPAAIL
jgi:hypothetical protein